MRKLFFGLKKVILVYSFLCFSIFLTSCTQKMMKAYYVDKSNYVRVTGIVTRITYYEDESVLHFLFSHLSAKFDDNCFEIVDDNLQIVKNNGIDNKIKIGDKVDFITARRYFYDGYVMPIVQISVNNEELLSFDEGYFNLIKWLNRQ